MTSLERARTVESTDRTTRDRNKEVVRQIVDRIFVHLRGSGNRRADRAGLRAPCIRADAARSGGLAQGHAPRPCRHLRPPVRDHDLIAERDRVAARLTTSARHTGMFMSIEPSGRRYSIDEIHIFRLRDGQLSEHWHEFDKASLLAQLKGEAPR